MDKQTKNNKKTESVAQVFIEVIGVTFATIVGFFLLIYLFILFLLYQDYFTYWNTSKIHTKEEMFQFAIDNQENLEQVVEDIQELYIKSKQIVLIDRNKKGDREKIESQSMDELFDTFAVYHISMTKKQENLHFNILFAFAPKGYDYWGIYYTQNGMPSPWGSSDMEEENGVYTQIGSDYKYETEHITGNWYYYQCDTR